MNNKEYVNPLDFFDDEESEDASQTEKPSGHLKGKRVFRGKKQRSKSQPSTVAKKGMAIFVTGTDTGVGKTATIKVLGALLKSQGWDVGVFKPVQCGGEDAQSLKDFLQISDPLKEVNPYFANEPVSPHIAFRRANIQVHREKILSVFHRLKAKHDILLVEGAGGLLAPVRDDSFVLDLVKDLELPLLIVSRPGLGTINHTLLTIEKARQMQIPVLGVIFCQTQPRPEGQPIGLAEETNPAAIAKFGQVPVLGTIPYIEEWQESSVVKVCQQKIKIKPLIAPVMTSNTKRWAHDDQQYLWHPFTQMKDWLATEPLVIEKAQGSYLLDTEGRRYLDGVASLWVNVHGHQHPTINRAIAEQLEKVSHSTFLGLSNIPAIRLAKELVGMSPKGLKKVFYSDNGSTSVEVAIKMAYQYWQNIGQPQKTKLVHLSNAYHGDTLGSVSVGGIPLFHQVYHNLIFPTISMPMADGYRQNNFAENLDALRRLLSQSHQDIAALIVEPLVQGAAGMLVWPPGILKQIKEACEQYNVFLICDEVATGFGRTGKMFACEHEQVTPDFLCLAKGLTGGYLPLAATLTTQKVFDGFCFDYKEQKTFFHGHTYTANPLACAAALANLKVFKQEQTLAKLQPKIKFLAESLKIFYNLPHVGHIRQMGFMVGIELVKNKETKEPFLWEDRVGVKVCERIRSRGVILRPLGNVIVLMPPLSMTMRELEYLTQATYEAIKELNGNSD